MSTLLDTTQQNNNTINNQLNNQDNKTLINKELNLNIEEKLINNKLNNNINNKEIEMNTPLIKHKPFDAIDPKESEKYDQILSPVEYGNLETNDEISNSHLWDLFVVFDSPTGKDHIIASFLEDRKNVSMKMTVPDTSIKTILVDNNDMESFRIDWNNTQVKMIDTKTKIFGPQSGKQLQDVHQEVCLQHTQEFGLSCSLDAYIELFNTVHQEVKICYERSKFWKNGINDYCVIPLIGDITFKNVYMNEMCNKPVKWNDKMTSIPTISYLLGLTEASETDPVLFYIMKSGKKMYWIEERFDITIISEFETGQFKNVTSEIKNGCISLICPLKLYGYNRLFKLSERNATCKNPVKADDLLEWFDMVISNDLLDQIENEALLFKKQRTTLPVTSGELLIKSDEVMDIYLVNRDIGLNEKTKTYIRNISISAFKKIKKFGFSEWKTKMIPKSVYAEDMIFMREAEIYNETTIKMYFNRLSNAKIEYVDSEMVKLNDIKQYSTAIKLLIPGRNICELIGKVQDEIVSLYSIDSDQYNQYQNQIPKIYDENGLISCVSNILHDDEGKVKKYISEHIQNMGKENDKLNNHIKQKQFSIQMHENEDNSQQQGEDSFEGKGKERTKKQLKRSTKRKIWNKRLNKYEFVKTEQNIEKEAKKKYERFKFKFTNECSNQNNAEISSNIGKEQVLNVECDQNIKINLTGNKKKRRRGYKKTEHTREEQIYKVEKKKEKNIEATYQEIDKMSDDYIIRLERVNQTIHQTDNLRIIQKDTNILFNASPQVKEMARQKMSKKEKKFNKRAFSIIYKNSKKRYVKENINKTFNYINSVEKKNKQKYNRLKQKVMHLNNQVQFGAPKDYIDKLYSKIEKLDTFVSINECIENVTKYYGVVFSYIFMSMFMPATAQVITTENNVFKFDWGLLLNNIIRGCINIFLAIITVIILYKCIKWLVNKAINKYKDDTVVIKPGSTYNNDVYKLIKQNPKKRILIDGNVPDSYGQLKATEYGAYKIYGNINTMQMAQIIAGAFAIAFFTNGFVLKANGFLMQPGVTYNVSLGNQITNLTLIGLYHIYQPHYTCQSIQLNAKINTIERCARIDDWCTVDQCAFETNTPFDKCEMEHTPILECFLQHKCKVTLFNYDYQIKEDIYHGTYLLSALKFKKNNETAYISIHNSQLLDYPYGKFLLSLRSSIPDNNIVYTNSGVVMHDVDCFNHESNTPTYFVKYNNNIQGNFKDLCDYNKCKKHNYINGTNFAKYFGELLDNKNIRVPAQNYWYLEVNPAQEENMNDAYLVSATVLYQINETNATVYLVWEQYYNGPVLLKQKESYNFTANGMSLIASIPVNKWYDDIVVTTKCETQSVKIEYIDKYNFTTYFKEYVSPDKVLVIDTDQSTVFWIILSISLIIIIVMIALIIYLVLTKCTKSKTMKMSQLQLNAFKNTRGQVIPIKKEEFNELYNRYKTNMGLRFVCVDSKYYILSDPDGDIDYLIEHLEIRPTKMDGDNWCLYRAIMMQPKAKFSYSNCYGCIVLNTELQHAYLCLDKDCNTYEEVPLYDVYNMYLQKCEYHINFEEFKDPKVRAAVSAKILKNEQIFESIRKSMTDEERKILNGVLYSKHGKEFYMFIRSNDKKMYTCGESDDKLIYYFKNKGYKMDYKLPDDNHLDSQLPVDKKVLLVKFTKYKLGYVMEVTDNCCFAAPFIIMEQEIPNDGTYSCNNILKSKLSIPAETFNWTGPTCAITCKNHVDMWIATDEKFKKWPDAETCLDWLNCSTEKEACEVMMKDATTRKTVYDNKSYFQMFKSISFKNEDQFNKSVEQKSKGQKHKKDSNKKEKWIDKNIKEAKTRAAFWYDKAPEDVIEFDVTVKVGALFYGVPIHMRAILKKHLCGKNKGYHPYTSIDYKYAGIEELSLDHELYWWSRMVPITLDDVKETCTFNDYIIKLKRMKTNRSMLYLNRLGEEMKFPTLSKVNTLTGRCEILKGDQVKEENTEMVKHCNYNWETTSGVEVYNLNYRRVMNEENIRWCTSLVRRKWKPIIDANMYLKIPKEYLVEGTYQFGNYHMDINKYHLLVVYASYYLKGSTLKADGISFSMEAALRLVEPLLEQEKTFYDIYDSILRKLREVTINKQSKVKSTYDVLCRAFFTQILLSRQSKEIVIQPEIKQEGANNISESSNVTEHFSIVDKFANTNTMTTNVSVRIEDVKYQEIQQSIEPSRFEMRYITGYNGILIEGVEEEVKDCYIPYYHCLNSGYLELHKLENEGQGLCMLNSIYHINNKTEKQYNWNESHWAFELWNKYGITSWLFRGTKIQCVGNIYNKDVVFLYITNNHVQALIPSCCDAIIGPNMQAKGDDEDYYGQYISLLSPSVNETQIYKVYDGKSIQELDHENHLQNTDLPYVMDNQYVLNTPLGIVFCDLEISPIKANPTLIVQQNEHCYQFAGFTFKKELVDLIEQNLEKTNQETCGKVINWFANQYLDELEGLTPLEAKEDEDNDYCFTNGKFLEKWNDSKKLFSKMKFDDAQVNGTGKIAALISLCQILGYSINDAFNNKCLGDYLYINRMNVSTSATDMTLSNVYSYGGIIEKSKSAKELYDDGLTPMKISIERNDAVVCIGLFSATKIKNATSAFSKNQISAYKNVKDTGNEIVHTTYYTDVSNYSKILGLTQTEKVHQDKLLNHMANIIIEEYKKTNTLRQVYCPEIPCLMLNPYNWIWRGKLMFRDYIPDNEFNVWYRPTKDSLSSLPHAQVHKVCSKYKMKLITALLGKIDRLVYVDPHTNSEWRDVIMYYCHQAGIYTTATKMQDVDIEYDPRTCLYFGDCVYYDPLKVFNIYKKYEKTEENYIINKTPFSKSNESKAPQPISLFNRGWNVNPQKNSQFAVHNLHTRVWNNVREFFHINRVPPPPVQNPPFVAITFNFSFFENMKNFEQYISEGLIHCNEGTNTWQANLLQMIKFIKCTFRGAVYHDMISNTNFWMIMNTEPHCRQLKVDVNEQVDNELKAVISLITVPTPTTRATLYGTANGKGLDESVKLQNGAMGYLAYRTLQAFDHSQTNFTPLCTFLNQYGFADDALAVFFNSSETNFWVTDISVIIKRALAEDKRGFISGMILSLITYFTKAEAHEIKGLRMMNEVLALTNQTASVTVFQLKSMAIFGNLFAMRQGVTLTEIVNFIKWCWSWLVKVLKYGILNDEVLYRIKISSKTEFVGFWTYTFRVNNKIKNMINKLYENSNMTSYEKYITCVITGDCPTALKMINDLKLPPGTIREFADSWDSDGDIDYTSLTFKQKICDEINNKLSEIKLPFLSDFQITLDEDITDASIGLNCTDTAVLSTNKTYLAQYVYRNTKTSKYDRLVHSEDDKRIVGIGEYGWLIFTKTEVTWTNAYIFKDDEDLVDVSKFKMSHGTKYLIKGRRIVEAGQTSNMYYRFAEEMNFSEKEIEWLLDKGLLGGIILKRTRLATYPINNINDFLETADITVLPKQGNMSNAEWDIMMKLYRICQKYSTHQLKWYQILYTDRFLTMQLPLVEEYRYGHILARKTPGEDKVEYKSIVPKIAADDLGDILSCKLEEEMDGQIKITSGDVSEDWKYYPIYEIGINFGTHDFIFPAVKYWSEGDRPVTNVNCYGKSQFDTFAQLAAHFEETFCVVINRDNKVEGVFYIGKNTVRMLTPSAYPDLIIVNTLIWKEIKRLNTPKNKVMCNKYQMPANTFFTLLNDFKDVVDKVIERGDVIRYVLSDNTVLSDGTGDYHVDGCFLHYTGSNNNIRMFANIWNRVVSKLPKAIGFIEIDAHETLSITNMDVISSESSDDDLDQIDTVELMQEKDPWYMRLLKYFQSKKETIKTKLSNPAQSAMLLNYYIEGSFMFNSNGDLSLGAVKQHKTLNKYTNIILQNKYSESDLEHNNIGGAPIIPVSVASTLINVNAIYGLIFEKQLASEENKKIIKQIKKKLYMWSNGLLKDILNNMINAVLATHNVCTGSVKEGDPKIEYHLVQHSFAALPIEVSVRPVIDLEKISKMTDEVVAKYMRIDAMKWITGHQDAISIPTQLDTNDMDWFSRLQIAMAGSVVKTPGYFNPLTGYWQKVKNMARKQYDKWFGKKDSNYTEIKSYPYTIEYKGSSHECRTIVQYRDAMQFVKYNESVEIFYNLEQVRMEVEIYNPLNLLGDLNTFCEKMREMATKLSQRDVEFLMYERSPSNDIIMRTYHIFFDHLNLVKEKPSMQLLDVLLSNTIETLQSEEEVFDDLGEQDMRDVMQQQSEDNTMYNFKAEDITLLNNYIKYDDVIKKGYIEATDIKRRFPVYNYSGYVLDTIPFKSLMICRPGDVVCAYVLSHKPIDSVDTTVDQNFIINDQEYSADPKGEWYIMPHAYIFEKNQFEYGEWKQFVVGGYSLIYASKKVWTDSHHRPNIYHRYVGVPAIAQIHIMCTLNAHLPKDIYPEAKHNMEYWMIEDFYAKKHKVNITWKTKVNSYNPYLPLDLQLNAGVLYEARGGTFSIANTNWALLQEEEKVAFINEYKKQSKYNYLTDMTIFGAPKGRTHTTQIDNDLGISVSVMPVETTINKEPMIEEQIVTFFPHHYNINAKMAASLEKIWEYDDLQGTVDEVENRNVLQITNFNNFIYNDIMSWATKNNVDTNTIKTACDEIGISLGQLWFLVCASNYDQLISDIYYIDSHTNKYWYTPFGITTEAYTSLQQLREEGESISTIMPQYIEMVKLSMEQNSKVKIENNTKKQLQEIEYIPLINWRPLGIQFYNEESKRSDELNFIKEMLACDEIYSENVYVIFGYNQLIREVTNSAIQITPLIYTMGEVCVFVKCEDFWKTKKKYFEYTETTWWKEFNLEGGKLKVESKIMCNEKIGVNIYQLDMLEDFSDTDDANILNICPAAYNSYITEDLYKARCIDDDVCRQRMNATAFYWNKKGYKMNERIDIEEMKVEELVDIPQNHGCNKLPNNIETIYGMDAYLFSYVLSHGFPNFEEVDGFADEESARESFIKALISMDQNTIVAYAWYYIIMANPDSEYYDRIKLQGMFQKAAEASQRRIKKCTQKRWDQGREKDLTMAVRVNHIEPDELVQSHTYMNATSTHVHIPEQSNFAVFRSLFVRMEAHTKVKVNTDMFALCLRMCIQTDPELNIDYFQVIFDNKEPIKLKEMLNTMLKGEVIVDNKFSIMIKKDESVLKPGTFVGRIICPPDSPTKTIGIIIATVFEEHLISLNHKGLSGFCCGNSGEMNYKIFRNHCKKYPNPVCISLDGASFDSTQFAELQEIIHIRLWELLEEDEFEDIHVFMNQIRELFRHDHYLAYSSSNHRDTGVPDIIAKLRGTSVSGHPLKTTYENTVKAEAYARYILLMARINGDVMCAGDDTLVIIDRSKLLDFCKHLRVVYDPNAGLGQVAKACIINGLEIPMAKFFHVNEHGRTIISSDAEISEALQQVPTAPMAVFCSVRMNYFGIVKSLENMLLKNVTMSNMPVRLVQESRASQFSAWTFHPNVINAMRRLNNCLAFRNDSKMTQDLFYSDISREHFITIDDQAFTLGELLVLDAMSMMDLGTDYMVFRKVPNQLYNLVRETLHREEDYVFDIFYNIMDFYSVIKKFDGNLSEDFTMEFDFRVDPPQATERWMLSRELKELGQRIRWPSFNYKYEIKAHTVHIDANGMYGAYEWQLKEKAIVKYEDKLRQLRNSINAQFGKCAGAEIPSCYLYPEEYYSSWIHPDYAFEYSRVQFDLAQDFDLVEMDSKSKKIKSLSSWDDKHEYARKLMEYGLELHWF